MFWLAFIVALLPEIRQEIVPIYKEADELLEITVSSIKTARKKIKISDEFFKPLNTNKF